MSRSIETLAVAILVAAVACGGGGGSEEDGPPAGACSGVTCSGHGTCYVDGTLPACRCDEGYRDSVLSCIPDATGSSGSCSYGITIGQVTYRTCVDYTGSSYSPSLVQQGCALLTDGVYSASPCSSEGRVGHCTVEAGLESEYVASDYAPMSQAVAQQACVNNSGQWTGEPTP